MTEGDILYLLRRHFTELTELKSEQFRRDPVAAIKAWSKFFSRIGDELIPADDLPGHLSATKKLLETETPDGWEEYYRQLQDICDIYPRYQEWKRAANAMDYADMIINCRQLLDQDRQIRQNIQDRYDTVLVDEFQDNNHALNLIMAQLVERHQSITVVGDEDQCIYRFRGASAYNYLDFQKRYGGHPNFRRIVLTTNYRSTQPILDLAEKVISGNPQRTPKKLVSATGSGRQPKLLIGPANNHVDAVAKYIYKGIESDIPLGDWAVLVRSHRQARQMAQGLKNRDLPTQYLTVNFFNLTSVRLILAWCDLLANNEAAQQAAYLIMRQALNRPPQREELQWFLTRIAGTHGIPPTIPELEPLCTQIDEMRAVSETWTAAEALWRIFTASGIFRTLRRAGFYGHRLALLNLGQLLELAHTFTRHYRDNSVHHFAHYLDVLRSVNAVETRYPKHPPQPDLVQVINVHQAKGREFSRVIIPYLTAQGFPKSYRSPKAAEDPPTSWLKHLDGQDDDPKAAHYEEELRIFYVAITRSEEELILLAPESRQSRFIRALPEEYFTMESISESQTTADKSPHDELATELRQRLSRELADGKFEQAHALVDALEMVRGHSRGRTIDWESNRLGADLRRTLETPEKSAIPPTDPLYLSASRITTYESCSLRYRFQYIDEIPQKDIDSPAMTVGRIVHAVLEEYHRPDQAEGARAILDILDRRWDPAAFSFQQEAAQYRREAEEMLKVYAARSAVAKPQVLVVEHRFEFQLDSVQIRGVIDRIDLEPGGGIGLVDYKTGRSFLTPKKARQELQLGLYAIYVEQAEEIELSGQQLGELPQNITYYYLRSEEPEVTVQFAAGDLDDHRNRVKATAEGIRAGEFEPTTDDWTCDHCDYKDLICPKFEQSEG
ncbi:MAG: ATP-dependent DNA helicase [Candidatus Neomarinimicrobiota bacterium]